MLVHNSTLRPTIAPGCTAVRAAGLSSVLVAVLHVAAVAQTTAPGLDPRMAITQYVHQVWTAETGLPQSTVWDMAQTPDGYLWLGTAVGLVRFDGVSFTVFNTRDTPELKQDDVRSLLVDRAGSLWIGTHRGGLTRLRQGRFTTYRRADGLPDDFVSCLHEDRRGTLWIGTGGGLARMTNGRPQPVPGLSARVFAVLEDAAGTVWLGSDSGAHFINAGRIASYRDRAGGIGVRVRAIAEDDAGGLWLGTPSGLVRLRGGQRTTYTTRDGLSAADITTLMRGSGGVLWVGTAGGGLVRYRAGRFDTFGTREGLSGDGVRSILEDREGSLWVSGSAGLDRFRSPLVTNFTESEGLPGGALGAVYGEATGALWIGTEGRGLIRLKEGRATRYTVADGLPSDMVLSTWRTADGTLWVGTRDGLARLEGGRFVNLSGKGGFPRGRVTALFGDRAGNLWIGSSDLGLQRWRDGRLVNDVLAEPVVPGWKARNIWTINEGADGTLWIGTVGGVLGLTNGRLTSYAESQGLVNPVATALRPDGNDLWIGTEGGGLYLLRSGTITALPLQNRVLLEDIWAILDDGRGYLWLSATQGIVRLRKQELRDVAAGTRRDFEVRVFDRLDGVKGQMDGLGESAGWRTSDGRLWFASNVGLVMVDPTRLPANPLAPPVHIERLAVDGRDVQMMNGVALPPGRGQLEIHYTAASLLIPERVTFRYKLEGFDQDWVDAGKRRVAYYTHLPGGRYRFRVIAANNDGVWNEIGASLAFRLRPHFYQTPWFLGLVAFALVLSGAGLYRMRAGQLRARTLRLATLVEERTKELQEDRDQLETRVQQRTAELAKVNEALAADITHRDRVEQALRLGEERYRLLYDDTPSMYFTVDPAGTVLSVNRFGASYLGYAVEELTGQSVLRVFFEADKASAVDHVAECIAHPERVFHWELRKVRKDGSLLWVKEAARAVRDPGGRLVVLIVCEDITERKRVEQQLLQAQKLESIGRLAGGVAHDLNNLLTAILGYADFVEGGLEPNHRVLGDLREIRQAGERAASLTQQLLAFARRQVVEPRIVDLNSLVLNLDKLLRRLIGEHIELVTVPAPGLWPVRADPHQIEQVVVNLALNARDAMPHGGILTIETAAVALDAEYAREHPEVTPGEHVLLAVSDTGTGIPEEIKAHLFEPFFTTKEQGKGTGLGLATCYGIVRQNGGHIWLYSEVGKGSTFKIYLPRSREAAQLRDRELEPATPPRGHETVLVVEDEATVRELAVRVLKAHGYRVLEAANGEHALRLMEEQPGTIDVLLTDVMMPKMGGKELAERLQELRPGLKVLYASGYAQSAITSQDVLDPGDLLLQKPFTGQMLAERLREVLDG